MNLRSGTVIRSGIPAESVVRSRASTQGSTARSQPIVSAPPEEFAYETLSDSSISSEMSHPAGHSSIRLSYDDQLTYSMQNTYGAKIYRDSMNRFAVKIEDHSSEFDPAPWVNYQEDRYMGRDRVMYLVVGDNRASRPTFWG